LTLSEPVGYTEARGHLFNAGFSQWANAIQMVIALILSVAVHEFGHAWAANRLGDTLPRLQGRLTLNPIRHIDPVGTIIIPLLMYGPFANAQEEGSMAVFASRESAEEFVREDPFVLNGVIRSWQIREWNEAFT